MLITFFILTFTGSWACFFGWGAMQAAAGHSVAWQAMATVVLYLGIFAPALVALLVTWWTEGRQGTGALLRRIVDVPLTARWVVFALVYFAVIKGAMALLHRLLAGDWPAMGPDPVILALAAIMISTPVQAGEEIGWRGFALPRLASRLGLPAASLLLGVLWAAWHLPLFFIAGTDSVGQSFPVYLLAVTALSAAMAWLYWRSGQRLLLVMLMHAAVNNTAAIVPSPGVASHPFTFDAPLSAWLTAALLWLCAAYFLVRMRGARLTNTPLTS